jgi:hypothetical protein
VFRLGLSGKMRNKNERKKRTRKTPGRFHHNSNDALGVVGPAYYRRLSGTYPNAIEYRFPATTRVEIHFNLTGSAIQSRDGATGTVSKTSPVLNRAGLLMLRLTTSTLRLLSPPPSIKPQPTPVFQPII